MNVHLDISEGARIHGHERQRLLEELGNGFLSVWNGANYKSRLQRKNTLRVKRPAVTQLRQLSNRRDIRAPLAHAHNLAKCPEGPQNGRGAWRQRNNSESRTGLQPGLCHRLRLGFCFAFSPGAMPGCLLIWFAT